VGWPEKGDGSSRQGMPQMKGLKELTLLVKQRIRNHMAESYMNIYAVLPYFIYIISMIRDTFCIWTT
jgi:hypothetical protein